MRTIPAGDLPSIDPIQGYRFWGQKPYSADLFTTMDATSEPVGIKPSSGLWLSPLLHGHTDCWGEFLDSVGWHGRLSHSVEVDPDTPVLLLDTAIDVEEYVHQYCGPHEFTDLLQFFDPAKFLGAGHVALYASRRMIGESHRSMPGLNATWDVPSLWINDPSRVHVQDPQVQELERSRHHG